MSHQKPVAFMSYSHADDKYGQLSEFRERLSHEVQVQTGEEFPIFQDRNDILLGQNWRQRIESALQQEVTFLIPILTPTFFKSTACREELELFLSREKALRRNDLVLPVYYVSCRVLEDEKLRAADSLAASIASRQWTDWRGLRFEPADSVQARKALMRLGAQICNALERIEVSRPIEEPRLIERTNTVKPSASRRTWDRTSFFADAAGKLTSEQVKAVESLLDFCLSLGCEVTWGTGTTKGSFNVKDALICPRSILTCYSNGNLDLNVFWLHGSELALHAQRRLSELAKVKLNVVAGSGQIAIDYWMPKAREVAEVIGGVLSECRELAATMGIGQRANST